MLKKKAKKEEEKVEEPKTETSEFDPDLPENKQRHLR